MADEDDLDQLLQMEEEMMEYQEDDIDDYEPEGESMVLNSLSSVPPPAALQSLLPAENLLAKFDNNANANSVEAHKSMPRTQFANRPLNGGLARCVFFPSIFYQ
jgi:hypothetical protein